MRSLMPFLAVLLACAAGAADPSFTLVREGRPACVIVTAAAPTPAARLAAQELQWHVLRMTGALLPVRTDDRPVAGPRVLVGESEASRALGFYGAHYFSQEYEVAFRPDTLVLIGRDWEGTERDLREVGRPMSCGDALADTRQRIDYWKTVGMPERSMGETELPGVYDSQGTCQAVYDFLERHCGVRWYGPGEAGMVLPRRATLSAGGPDLRRSPALKYRDALWSGNWPFMRGQWGEVSRPEVFLYWRRLRLGGEKWAGNHTFHPRTINAMFTNPEYQAKGPGKGTQLCYTSPALADQVAQMARDFFDGKQNAPEGWKAAGDYFAIVPDDNAKFCRCDACRALLAKGRGRATGMFSDGRVSDYFFTFVNEVARRVRTTHPDKRIATLAYWNYAYPPTDFSLEPNVSIAPCLHTCMYALHREIRENDMRLYKDWIGRAKSPVFLWSYYHHPMEPALIDKWKCFPNVMVHETARAMRMYIADGVRGIFVCGEQDMLESYVIAKLWDDPELDLDALLDEFFILYFGNAAEPMKRFYLEIERIATNPENYPAPYYRKDGVDWKSVAWECLGTEERMTRLGALMDQAQAAASTEQEKLRVGLWHDALWKWMQEGRAEHLAAPAGKTSGNP